MGREDYYDEFELAEVLGLAKATLEKRRSIRKDHPPFVKIGKTVLYPKKDFAKWMEAHLIRELAEDGSGSRQAEARKVRAALR